MPQTRSFYEKSFKNTLRGKGAKTGIGVNMGTPSLAAMGVLKTVDENYRWHQLLI